MASATQSRIGALSRTVRVTPCSMLSPHEFSPTNGPADTRPRDGFNPTSPHALAGMRIEPPPSLACPMATMPLATAAPDPPDDPPVERLWSHGLRDGP